MKKFVIQVIALIILLTASFLIVFNINFFDFSGIAKISPSQNQRIEPNTVTVKVGNAVVNAEVADTPDKRAQGLGGRSNLASDSGMLFVFDKPDKYQFWMKGIKFPLDFIWIRNNKVVDLLKNIPPPAPNQSDSTLNIYEPVVPVDHLLEVNGGFSDQNGIKVGDSVKVLSK